VHEVEWNQNKQNENKNEWIVQVDSRYQLRKKFLYKNKNSNEKQTMFTGIKSINFFL
jgi:hypothetical protein